MTGRRIALHLFRAARDLVLMVAVCVVYFAAVTIAGAWWGGAGIAAFVFASLLIGAILLIGLECAERDARHDAAERRRR